MEFFPPAEQGQVSMQIRYSREYSLCSNASIFVQALVVLVRLNYSATPIFIEITTQTYGCWMPISFQKIVASCGIIAVCALAAVAKPLNERALRQSLDNLLDSHPTALHTTVTLKVVDLDTGDVLYDRGGDKLLTPASNLKMYTSACALDLFGPLHRFDTRLIATGPINESGILQGDLILVGGGNSMLSNHDLALLAGRVVEQWHVRRIEGHVIVDNSRYAPRLKGPGWMWDDDPDYYNMSITPLMVDFNVLVARLSTAKDGSVEATLIPKSAYPPIRKIPNGVGPSIESKITRQPFQEPLLLSGSVAPEQPTDSKLTMHDPGPWIAAMFVQMLVDRQVEFADAPAESFSSTTESLQPSTAAKEISYTGSTLTETLRHFNHVSENAVGEVLLHEIAIARGIQQPSWPDGAEAISQWLVQTAGLEPGSFRLVDGSGLSRYNLISATSAIDLLTFMQQHPHAAVFASGMPNLDHIEWSGVPDDEFDPESVRAKSGGMSGVSTISGYLQTRSGRRLAFSLLANGFIGKNTPLLDLRGKVWRQLVQYQPGETIPE